MPSASGVPGTNVDDADGMSKRPVTLRRALRAGAAALAAVAGASTAAFAQAAGCPAPFEPAAAAAAAGVAGVFGTDSAAPRADTVMARTRPGDADIVLLASVAARTVEFRTQPQVRVRLCWGDGRGDSLRVVERRNLPTPVAAGTVYRDVYVAVQLLGHLNAVCLLREIGVSDSLPGATPPVACPSITGSRVR